MSTNTTYTQFPADSSPYKYIPTKWICILYVVLFGTLTLLHLVRTLQCKLWWLFPTLVVGGLTEVLGWSARLWSSINTTDLDPFIMQMTTTIMAPSFMTAANFLILGILIFRLGPQYSRLSPSLYSIIFLSADGIALTVQAVGGAFASVAGKQHTSATTGANIMLAGIFWQMAAMTVYAVLAVEFFTRVRLNKPIQKSVEQHKPTAHKGGFSIHGTFDPVAAKAAATKLQTTGFELSCNLSLMVLALFVSTSLIYIRSIYRTIELLGGWTGTVITTEWYFNVFDGCPIVLALFTLLVLHPAWLLRENATMAQIGRSPSETTLAGVELVTSNLEKGWPESSVKQVPSNLDERWVSA